MPLIQFTVLEQATEDMVALGCGGLIVTNAELTPRVIEALNKFWMENSNQFEDGDTFTINVYHDA
jgi:hypothetical protein